MEDNFIVIGAAVAILAFYVPFFLLMVKGVNCKTGRRRFFRSIKSTLAREEDDSKAIEQLSIIHRRIAENNSEYGKKYRTSIDICEDLLSRSEGYAEWFFKFHYGINFSLEEINRIASIIKVTEEQMPFISLSSKYGNQLDMLKIAYDQNDKALGFNGLKQLAKDIKFLESTLNAQERKNKISTWISVIGIILTIIFGAATIIQFFTAGKLF